MLKLPKIKTKSKKRVGRGYGSGKGGHTVGRGQKGQKARGSMGILFEGFKVKKSLIKRLPLKRGKGKFKRRKKGKKNDTIKKEN
jgi:large subunit ribosomal protein L15